MFGSDMVEYLIANNEHVQGLNSAELDLTQEEEIIEDSIKDFDVVINAAAFTNVNLAETEQTRAFEINKDLPLKLARITARNNQKLIHISTDYVFDGKTDSPYLTTDSPSPKNVYGESKLAGEKEITKHNPEALIIRTSWLYGPKGHCFPKAIINKLNQQSQLSVVDDQFGTPTSTWFLREFVYRAIKENFEPGIHHGVPTGKTSWFGFAQVIAGDDRHQIIPIKTTSQEGVAERPKHGQLKPHPSTKKSWQECWDEIKQEFLGDEN
jgi:dTDP-4-dehydrorhamnose reductase